MPPNFLKKSINQNDGLAENICKSGIFILSPSVLKTGCLVHKKVFFNFERKSNNLKLNCMKLKDGRVVLRERRDWSIR